MNKTRSAFTHSALLFRVRSAFKSASQALNKPNGISLQDCLMSGLAIFSLKFQSLLKFEEGQVSEPLLLANLHSLYGIKKVPCDTYLRERLDFPFVSIVKLAMNSLVALLQRSKVLESYKFIDGKYLIPLDATGFFSSQQVHCEYCCEKVHKKNTDKEYTDYQHQMLVGCIVSPDFKQVIPINFEPIIREDGAKKNDCERNCGKRWLMEFRKAHPQLPTIIVGDGLYSNAPFIRECQTRRCSYILIAKEDDHKHLYKEFRAGSGAKIEEFVVDSKEYRQLYRFKHNIELNEANHDIKVNVLYFEEFDKKKNKTTTWVWVTDLEITKANAHLIMQGGRARWKIENETFNTLKNQGYKFEHNFGHGYKGLSNVFAGLMLTAFLIDQILALMNFEYKAVVQKLRSLSNSFEKIRNIIFFFHFESFEKLYQRLIVGSGYDKNGVLMNTGPPAISSAV